MTHHYKDAIASRHHYDRASQACNDDPRTIAIELLHGIPRGKPSRITRANLPDINLEDAVFVTVPDPWHMRLAKRHRTFLKLLWQFSSNYKTKARKRTELIG